MPFVRTAVLGSSGAPVLDKGEFVNHFGLIRLRATGAGVLRSKFWNMDIVSSSTLATVTLAETSATIKEVKGNFSSQRASLQLETAAIDEVVTIQKIIIFVRPLWSSLPG